jgi:hypothetical protein
MVYKTTRNGAGGMAQARIRTIDRELAHCYEELTALGSLYGPNTPNPNYRYQWPSDELTAVEARINERTARLAILQDKYRQKYPNGRANGRDEEDRLALDGDIRFLKMQIEDDQRTKQKAEAKSRAEGNSRAQGTGGRRR